MPSETAHSGERSSAAQASASEGSKSVASELAEVPHLGRLVEAAAAGEPVREARARGAPARTGRSA